jgi:hypothetical protein
MTFSQKDFTKLQIPLLSMVVMLLIAGLLVWWSMGLAEKSKRENVAANASKNQVDQRLRQVRTEEQELKEKAQIFQQMQNSGMAGEEKRLDWTEMLRNTQREMRLPGMTYEFGAQIPIDTVEGAAFAYFTSPMRLQLRLLHEQDLLNFLNRIQKEASALVLVRSCKLSPLTRSNDARDGLAQLGAECELQWVTVRRSTGTK